MGKNKISQMMNGPYDVTGERGDRVRALAKNYIDASSKTTIFTSGIELYVTAAIVGVLTEQRKEPMKSVPGKDFAIFGEQFKNHYDDVKLAFQLVMLSHDKDRTTARERVNNAFKYVISENDEIYQHNIDIFESYILGGIDYLYDHFIDGQNINFDDFVNSAKALLNKDSEKTEEETEEIIDLSGPIF